MIRIGKVVICIPAYNEEKTIGPVIDEIKRVMSKTSYRYIIHVQNDGSYDDTVAVAKKHGARVFSNRRNRGLAITFQREMSNALKAGADVIVHTDADGQYVATGIPKMLKKIEEGYELVLGSRFAGSIEHMPFMKRLGNKAFSKTLSRMTRTKLTDTTTGFRAFTKEVAEEIHYINTFTYTQEQIIKAARKKFRIVEVPIRARKTRDSRLFNSSFQYAVRAWVNIIRIYRDFNPIKFFGLIGLFFMAIGGILGIYILYLAFNGFSIDTRVPTIVLSAMIFLTGLQIALFGLLADKMN